MCSRARLDRRSLLMLDLSAVLICFSPLNDLSAVHKVTWRVQRTVTRAFILGKKVETRVNVADSDEGSAFIVKNNSKLHVV